MYTTSTTSVITNYEEHNSYTNATTTATATASTTQQDIEEFERARREYVFRVR